MSKRKCALDMVSVSLRLVNVLVMKAGKAKDVTKNSAQTTAPATGTASQRLVRAVVKGDTMDLRVPIVNALLAAVVSGVSVTG
jgi:hypothetical protein